MDHAIGIVNQLAPIMRSNDRSAAAEATRLYHLIEHAMSDLRHQCPYSKDIPRVAFFPVATYDDESGTSTPATDTITYPADCTPLQRRQIQYAEACRQFGTPTASGDSPNASTAASRDSANASSDSSTRGLVDSSSAGAEAPTAAAAEGAVPAVRRPRIKRPIKRRQNK